MFGTIFAYKLCKILFLCLKSVHKRVVKGKLIFAWRQIVVVKGKLIFAWRQRVFVKWKLEISLLARVRSVDRDEILMRY